MKIISIILYLCFTVGGLVFVKAGSNSVIFTIKNGIFSFSMGIKTIIGFLLYISSFFIYVFYVIKNFNLSYIYPIITGITQVLIVIIGVILFKEHISIQGIFGIIFIMLGMVFLNIK